MKKFLLFILLNLLLIYASAQKYDSIYRQNYELIKNCDAPFSHDAHPIQINHTKAFERDYPIIRILNEIESINYKTYKKQIRRIKKSYLYRNEYYVDSLHLKFWVENCQLYNKGFVTLSLSLYMDEHDNILYRHFNLAVGTLGNDSKYLKFILPSIKIILNFTSCYFVQGDFGNKILSKYKGEIAKKIL